MVASKGLWQPIVKAAEDSRTPRPGGGNLIQCRAVASWSAAVLCRFHETTRKFQILPWQTLTLSAGFKPVYAFERGDAFEEDVRVSLRRLLQV
jgi:hypothetical protein